MLAALALWLWIHTDDEKLSSALLFGAVLFLCGTIHYYAFFCLVPYAAWTVASWKPWRLPSAKMMAGGVGSLCALGAFSRLFLGLSRVVPMEGWSKPSIIYGLREIFRLFRYGWLFIVLIVLWTAWVGLEDKLPPLQPMASGERVGWLFFCIPLAGYALAQTTHVFTARHLVGTLPGIAVAFSCWVWRHFRHTRHISGGILLLLASAGLVRQVWIARNPDNVEIWPISQISRTKHALSLEEALRNDGKQFSVVCDGFLHLQTFYYSEHPERYRLLVFSDLPNLSKLDLLSLHQLYLESALARYYPLQFWRLEDLKSHALDSALIDPSPNLPDALKQAGFQTRVRFGRPLEVVYLEYGLAKIHGEEPLRLPPKRGSNLGR
jgi:hypothetical protein